VLVGSLPKDKHQGKLVEMYNRVMSEAEGVTVVDVAAGFGNLFSVKEVPELMNHKKVSDLCFLCRFCCV
jgi:nucleosome binding factor SPN SPT16 subunit